MIGSHFSVYPCRGGCPVQTYTITGQFLSKDRYCEVYKTLFSELETMAAAAASASSPFKSARSLPVLAHMN